MVQRPLRGNSMGRWIKDLKEKRKEVNRSQNVQIHAAVTVTGVVVAITAVTAATTTSSSEDSLSKAFVAVASAAALVVAQCVKVAESMGANREHLAAIVSSVINVWTGGDIMTLTAAATTGESVPSTSIYFRRSKGLVALWLPICTAATDESVVGRSSPSFMDFHLPKGFIQPILENCLWHFADCYERCSEGVPVFCLPDFLADGSNNTAFKYRLS